MSATAARLATTMPLDSATNMPLDPVSDSPARSRSVGRMLPSSGAIVPQTRMPRNPAHMSRSELVAKRFAGSA